MESDLCYNKAIDLLKKVTTTDGFLASSENLSNYNRVWARDGVICGLAALASADESLINGFKNTLQTLAKNQHKNGTIPSNVSIIIDKYDVSYGGLAGRVDAVNWFLIGICQYAYHQNEPSFVSQYLPHINKCLSLLEAWEFNNKHLLYVPLSGNWADEYITDGYVLYDQLLRVWALRCLKYYIKDDYITQKEEQVTNQITINFTPNNPGEKYHQNAYEKLVFDKFMPCSFSPAGYKTEFDAFATSLALMLNIGDTDFQQQSLNYAFNLSKSTALKMLPAFWPPIFETDPHWNLLKDNCKYEFRNFPYEFHNGGSWPMVNGFFGLALQLKNENEKANEILNALNEANAINDFSFFENFNTETKQVNGVPYCSWSAAATVLVHQSLNHKYKPLL